MPLPPKRSSQITRKHISHIIVGTYKNMHHGTIHLSDWAVSTKKNYWYKEDLLKLLPSVNASDGSRKFSMTELLLLEDRKDPPGSCKFNLFIFCILYSLPHIEDLILQRLRKNSNKHVLLYFPAVNTVVENIFMIAIHIIILFCI